MYVLGIEGDTIVVVINGDKGRSERRLKITLTFKINRAAPVWTALG
jgi:hypothetical protein